MTVNKFTEFLNKIFEDSNFWGNISPIEEKRIRFNEHLNKLKDSILTDKEKGTMTSHIINYKSEDIVSEKVLSVYTDTDFCDSSEINLNEVVDYKILHPDSEGQMTFLRTDVRRVGKFKRHERPDLVLLEAAIANSLKTQRD